MSNLDRTLSDRRCGRRLMSICLVLILVAVWLASTTTTARADHAPATPHDEGWASGFGLPGIEGAPYVLASGLNGSLYAGGGFMAACGTTVGSIARWDGSQWQPLSIGATAQVGLVVVALVLALAAEASLASRRGKIGVKDYPTVGV